MTIRIAVAGVGRIGRLHAAIVAGEVPGATLAAVFDVDGQAARQAAARHGVDAAASMEELLASPDVDAIAICTATDTHADLITRTARAGKAVFTEKPVSLSLAEVDDVIAVVDDTGVPFMAGFQRRFDPGHRGVADAVRDGRIGAVHLLRLTSRDPAPPPLEYLRSSGGLFLDCTIHDFDLARFVVGTPVVRVYAQGAVRVDPAIGELGDIDTAVVVLTHACGAITTIDNSRSARYGYDQRVEAFGALGMVQSHNHRRDAVEAWTADGSHAAPLQDFFLDRYRAAYVREWRAFVDYLRDGGASPVSAREARAPVVIGEAAGLSRREGRPVDVDGG